MGPNRWANASWLAGVLLSTTAQAHLMPAQQGSLNLLDQAVFAVVAIPVSALPAAIDRDRDGRLSAAELQAPEVNAQLLQRMRLFDGEQAGRVDFIQVMAEQDERNPASAAGGSHFILMAKFSFSAPPLALRIETDLFGAAASEQQLTLKASRGSEIEVAVLSTMRGNHFFFRQPWQVLGDQLLVGVEHILLGTDHLLFLLTIVVAAAGWRYWLGVLTSFTIAHSISLTAALLGWVQVASSIVEPLIAASIVLMALLNLGQKQVIVRQRMAIVFACGLLHGLGFASAISDFGLQGKALLAVLEGLKSPYRDIAGGTSGTCGLAQAAPGFSGCKSGQLAGGGGRHVLAGRAHRRLSHPARPYSRLAIVWSCNAYRYWSGREIVRRCRGPGAGARRAADARKADSCLPAWRPGF